MAYAPQGNAIQWELAWLGALLTGALAAILTAIPGVSWGCCLWMLGAGALSVALYQWRAPGATITPGMGMRLGALAGVFAFVVNACITTALFVFRSSRADIRRTLQEAMNKQIASNPDPKVQEMMQHLIEWLSTPQGVATMIVLVLIVMFVMFILFTAAGGALGASMFGKRREFR